jgi:hypothetical protein
MSLILFLKIGFNKGNGSEFFKVLPYSGNPRFITDLDQNSNVNYRGRYIYKVEEWIQPAGCKNDFSNGTYGFYEKNLSLPLKKFNHLFRDNF